MEKFVNRMIEIRRIISPRTSYNTSGTSATEIFIWTKNISSDYTSISQLLTKTKEFEKVTVSDDLSSIDTHIIIFPVMDAEDKDIVQNIIIERFQAKKSRLCFVYTISGNLAKLLHTSLQSSLDNLCVEVASYQYDAYMMIAIHIPISTMNITSSSSNSVSDRGFNGQVSVQSRHQFQYLWHLPSCFPTTSTGALHSINDCKIRVIQRLLSKDAYDKKTNKKLVAKDWDIIIHDMIADGRDDYDIYNMIRQVTVGSSIEEALSSSTSSSATISSSNDEDGRSQLLVKLVLDCLPKHLVSHRNVHRILDYGCAEGAITALLGSSLQLPPANIYGADIRAIPSPGFTFLHLRSEEEYIKQQSFYMFPSIPDASIDVINASMVFHHVTNIHQVLAELRRIISSSGCLILREHFCDTPEMAAFLDITHGLYSLSWSNPIEWPLFLSEYQASYRHRDQWTEILQRAGFMLYHPSSCSNPSNAHGLCYHVDTTRVKKDQSITNVIKAYYATYVPDPNYVAKPVPIPMPAALQAIHHPVSLSGNNKEKKRSYDMMTSTTSSTAAHHDADTGGKELWESKKYPGMFYYVDSVTSKPRWVTMKDGHDTSCVDSETGTSYAIIKIHRNTSS